MFVELNCLIKPLADLPDVNVCKAEVFAYLRQVMNQVFVDFRIDKSA